MNFITFYSSLLFLFISIFFIFFLSSLLLFLFFLPGDDAEVLQQLESRTKAAKDNLFRKKKELQRLSTDFEEDGRRLETLKAQNQKVAKQKEHLIGKSYRHENREIFLCIICNLMMCTNYSPCLVLSCLVLSCLVLTVAPY